MLMQRFRFILLLFFYSGYLFSQQVDFTNIRFQKFYKVGKDNKVFMPLGEISFADKIISFRQGKPKAKAQFSLPKNALGAPNYVKYPDDTYLSLGCYGELVVQFQNNGFINIDGPDLYFFEVGPSIEAFDVEISVDGKNWLHIGDTSGGSSYVDIASAEENAPRNIYYYVKLTDLGSFCDGPTAGADIDAIGAIGGVLKVNINAQVLFDLDKYNLKKEAADALNNFLQALKKIPKAEIIIEGHTDNQASKTYNLTLGKNRAKRVKTFLLNKLESPENYQISIKSYGEEKPVNDNKTKAGRQQNRRVEIIVLPDREFYEVGD